MKDSLQTYLKWLYAQYLLLVGVYSAENILKNEHVMAQLNW